MRLAAVLKEILEHSTSLFQYITLEKYLMAERFVHFIKKNITNPTQEKKTLWEANSISISIEDTPTHFMKLESSLPFQQQSATYPSPSTH